MPQPCCEHGFCRKQQTHATVALHAPRKVSSRLLQAKPSSQQSKSFSKTAKTGLGFSPQSFLPPPQPEIKQKLVRQKASVSLLLR